VASLLGEVSQTLNEKKGACVNSRSGHYKEVDDASAFDKEITFLVVV